MGYQPRSASVVSRPSISRPGIDSPSPRLTLTRMSGSGKFVVASTMAFATTGGLLALEDARTDEDRLRAELHHQRRVGRGGDAAGAEHRHRQFAGLGDLLHERQRCLEPLGPLEQFGGVGLGDLADVAEDRTQVANRLDDVAGARLALRANHARTLGDAPQRLAEVGGAAHERHGERPLVDVVRFVGRRQHFGLVDVVDAERLQDLRLGEVTDAGLGHHRES